LARARQAHARSRHHTLRTQGHGQIVDAVSISECPASVEDRLVPGHWEGGLVFGSHNSQIATLVERQTRYVMLVKLDGKDSQTVVKALIKHAHKLPQELCKSLTWDRGTCLLRRDSPKAAIACLWCISPRPLMLRESRS
jgi:IS30 family transposase